MGLADLLEIIQFKGSFKLSRKHQQGLPSHPLMFVLLSVSVNKCKLHILYIVQCTALRGYIYIRVLD
jgi:hypothetical protein